MMIKNDILIYMYYPEQNFLNNFRTFYIILLNRR